MSECGFCHEPWSDDHQCPVLAAKRLAARVEDEEACQMCARGNCAAHQYGATSGAGSDNGNTPGPHPGDAGSTPARSTKSRAVRTFQPKSWEEHLEAWHHWGRVAEGALWGRAAVAYSLRETFHAEGVEKFAETVKQTTARVYQLAQVFAAFPGESNRFDSLSFTHHQLAAGTEDPQATLTKAQEEGWSANALRRHLAPPTAPAKPSAAESLVSAVAQDQDEDAAPVDEAFSVKAERDHLRRLVQRCPAADLEALAEALRFALDRIADRFLNAA